MICTFSPVSAIGRTCRRTFKRSLKLLQPGPFTGRPKTRDFWCPCYRTSSRYPTTSCLAVGTMESVSQRLIRNIAGLQIEGTRPYIDVSILPRLFDNGELSKILEEHGASPYQARNYSNVIRSKAIKLFAILVRIQQPLFIIPFIECQIYDDKLPLNTLLLQALPNASLLNPLFFDTQFDFIPHFFERGLHSHINDNRTVLPYDEVQRLPDLDGSFGSISRVTIHPEFHNLSIEPVRCILLP
ncbi:hypothetical protein K505DRAFT_344512 [Melanomma pulvis-pyrius CBS 109.77]|uniref:Uncharacterized protein n=1 Tax=Melanomma pulvis-pyrius CBS 109.77 TaxID=1314802 RepID=A0A6A6WNF9_9PLEO|nr:hypothetical protein K505DRAFT_344512 [Melanomma pulvis-pyrius CBS 109.77]